MDKWVKFASSYRVFFSKSSMYYFLIKWVTSGLLQYRSQIWVKLNWAGCRTNWFIYGHKFLPNTSPDLLNSHPILSSSFFKTEFRWFSILFFSLCPDLKPDDISFPLSSSSESVWHQQTDRYWWWSDRKRCKRHPSKQTTVCSTCLNFGHI